MNNPYLFNVDATGVGVDLPEDPVVGLALDGGANVI